MSMRSPFVVVVVLVVVCIIPRCGSSRASNAHNPLGDMFLVVVVVVSVTFRFYSCSVTLFLFGATIGRFNCAVRTIVHAVQYHTHTGYTWYLVDLGSHCATQCSCISRALARAQISSEKLSFPLNPASTVAEYTILFMINIGGRRTIAIGIRAVRYSHIAWAIVIVFTKGMRKVATNEQETKRLRSTHSPTNENTPT